MEKIKLLFVEDDNPFSFIITESLELTGQYEIRTASNGQEGLEAYKIFRPDIIVCAINMPILDGLKMVEIIRQKDKIIPILIVTAKTAVKDVIEGYQLDVDDYIKKPIHPMELDCHIHAVLKRVNGLFLIQNKKEFVPLGDYIFYIEKQQLLYHDKTDKLTDKETKILEMLYDQRGKLVKRDHLLKKLWGINDFFTSRSLDVFIASLRKHLSSDSNVKIETIRGKGLQLDISIS
jgi:DNA-binding response OmpR family regulator